MLKITETVVTIMTLLQHQRSQLAFTLVHIQKHSFSSVPENTCALKSKPGVRVHVNYCKYRFVKTLGLFSIIRLYIRLLTFATFV